MLKAIIFDVGNVLISWPRDAVYADLKETLGLDDTQLAQFWEKYLHKFGLGEITQEEIWSSASKEFHIRKVDVTENLLGRAFEAEGIVFKDVLKFAKRLKKRGFKMALLSNTVSVHEQVFSSKGVAEPFDFLFLSHKIGLRKPDPEIYLHALKELQVEPTEALFIDDLTENVEAAQKLGMRTVPADNPATIVQKIEHELEEDFIGTKAALLYQDKVLAILRDNIATIPFPDSWDFPGGSREKDETPLEVVIREIKEELNITLAPKDFVWQEFYPGVSDPILTTCFVVANLTEKQVNGIVLGDEGQDWKFMTFQEFMDHPKAIKGMKKRLEDYLRLNSTVKPAVRNERRKRTARA